ncbi:MAG: class II aldolase/adducin family protein [Desulfobacterales bacterium]|nr:class II aldolase/adducin family protein [Desulfobacterales bacterium]
MENIIKKYENKLYSSGLTEKEAPIIGFLDADIEWNKNDKFCGELEKIFKNLNINSLLYCQPAEPYKTIIEHLSKNSNGVIYPEDCETRTFLHDLPVSFSNDINSIIPILKKRKSVIFKDSYIITFGTVSIEQAFVTFSSVCFACFVKFFSDFLKHKHVDKENYKIFKKAVDNLDSPVISDVQLIKGPFNSKNQVIDAICESGNLTVFYRLVDSYFGNISCLFNDILFISQTGSSLDDLKNSIDMCPLDESSCSSITASSELPAHMNLVKSAPEIKTILHGHPKFSVILSMDCNEENCSLKGQCHIRCSKKRYACELPIVPGEVGSGVYGLCNTMPPAIKDHKGVLVYGHGVFTAGKNDFNEPFHSLVSIENDCRNEYFKRISHLL